LPCHHFHFPLASRQTINHLPPTRHSDTKVHVLDDRFRLPLQYKLNAHQSNKMPRKAAPLEFKLFNNLPPEIQAMVFDQMQLLEVEESCLQLEYRHHPVASRLNLVSKAVAKASKDCIRSDQVRPFEITQRNLVFMPEGEGSFCEPQADSWARSTQLILNFNINETIDDMFREMVVDLQSWILGCIDEWHDRRGDDTPREDGDVVVRFWVNEMFVYDEFKPIINELWNLTAEDEDGDSDEDSDSGLRFGNRARIEMTFYKRSDYKPYPNADCIAEATVLETWTEATEWQPNDSAIAQARDETRHSWYWPLKQEVDHWMLGHMEPGDSDKNF
jgi:hypothetical protein